MKTGAQLHLVCATSNLDGSVSMTCRPTQMGFYCM